MAKLTDVEQAFILHWGEMGTRWGINRTVAQIHALLYLSPVPRCAGEIADMLAVARSNVSNSLKELQNWGVVKVVHVLGDRRDHFEAIQDVWEMFQLIADGRKRRECDPTLTTLRALTAQAKAGGKRDAVAHKRLSDLLGFYEAVSRWYGDVRRMPTKSLIKLVKLGGKVSALLGRGR